LQETPDLHGAFPRLDPEQIGLVAAYGERRPTRRGDVLFREGDRDYDFFVIESGTVEDSENGEALRVHGPGRFLGELGQLTGLPRPVPPAERPAAGGVRGERRPPRRH
jgi:thioredoxin reductase (NADPH)